MPRIVLKVSDLGDVSGSLMEYFEDNYWLRVTCLVVVHIGINWT